MAIDFNKVANASINAVQKVAKEAGATLPIKLDMPNDSFGGKILDTDGIEAVMKKFDLLIAQANEKLAEITKKYNQEKALSKQAMGSRHTWEEHKKATSALKELRERKAKFQQKPELVQEFLDEQQKAPNTSFLFDPLLSKDEKKAILATHSEIIKLQNIYSAHPTIETMVTSGKFFDNKLAGGQIYIDLSDPINAQNYQRLISATPLSFTKVAKEIGMSRKEIWRYCANGFFEPIKLIDRKTGEEVYTRAIDWQSDRTKAGLERLKQLNALAPKASKQVAQMRAQGKRIQVPTFYLSKLGYGPEEEINKMLLAKKIPFTTKEVIGKNNQPRKVVVADLTGDKACAHLKFMLSENKDLCTVEQMAKIAKVSKTEIEDALLSGELIPQKESLFTDGKEIVINAKAKANLAFIDKKTFEKQLSKENTHKETSLRSELAWHFCPKTKQAASQGYAMNMDEIKKTQAQILAIKEKITNPNLTAEEVADFENELLRLKNLEDMLNQKSRAFMWKTAGEEEYNQGMARAKELMAQVDAQGIDSIEDEEIRAIFQAHQG